MEYQDLFSKADGHYVGRHERGEKIPDGTYLHLVCVFTLNDRREILLTKRAPTKSYPLAWENTAGAVKEGEELRHAARRELLEETGIDVNPEELIDLGYLETTSRNAYMHGFFLKNNTPLEDIRLQQGETVDAKWVKWDWNLCFHPEIAKPVRIRLLYFWSQIDSFMDPAKTEDPNLTNTSRYEPWLTWAKTLQFLAQQGQAYANNGFDKERFDAISHIAGEILSYKTGIDVQRVLDLFAPTDDVYRTPNVEVRCAVFRGDQILLVKERRPEKWSLPGGWCDPGLTLSENAQKEVWEESGLHVQAARIVAIEDRNREDYQFRFPWDIYKIYVLCEACGETDAPFEENLETVARGFFPLDALPELSLARVTPRTIGLCFAAKDDPQWQTHFD
ncbi:MAG: NUDIX hydrolase N-terminal domain-containing protein [Peptoniphilaceae bacterium]|nr:NUDIX hydrolase N-terminal domain-containing protein [Peptoniphilaceae bacterium]MDY6085317.1 NUDIX hydrolase N-terminal domain-containing protein [Peptoniphilaceae bacterium]